jgi:hypothetical protein
LGGFGTDGKWGGGDLHFHQFLLEFLKSILNEPKILNSKISTISKQPHQISKREMQQANI